MLLERVPLDPKGWERLGLFDEEKSTVRIVYREVQAAEAIPQEEELREPTEEERKVAGERMRARSGYDADRAARMKRVRARMEAEQRKQGRR